MVSGHHSVFFDGILIYPTIYLIRVLESEHLIFPEGKNGQAF